MLSLFRRKKRLLVLEDDSSMVRLIRSVLEKEFLVDSVMTGRDAIDRLREGDNVYGLVLLDLMMPTEGGLTVLRHLQEQAPQLLGRVVIMSAAPTSLIEPFRDSIKGILPKPFTREALATFVRDALA